MAKSTDNKKSKKVTSKQNLKTAAWLVESSFRALTGWVLLSNFDHYVTTAVAFYALATAGIIVVVHFFKANS